jgi:glucose/mannose-6-phosphate isomerase
MPSPLDDAGARARVDVHQVHAVLAAFPGQCRAARVLAVSPAPAGPRPRAVVVAGMGGSASGGDLLAACAAERLEVPVIVHRGYGLPAFAGPGDLVIASSYSGETAETLSAARAALDRGCTLAAVTSGGALAALVRERARPRVEVPPDLMPRMALGYLFFPLLTILGAVGLAPVSAADADEVLAVLDRQARALEPAVATGDNEAKRLALAIGERLPVIYGGPLTGRAAYRWKTDIEENAKALAVAGAVPEMNHNEVEAWRPPDAGRRCLVLLRDPGEPAPIARRFAITKDLIGGAAGGVAEACAQGTSPLARLLSLAYLGQWVSYYLALARQVDPWSVPVLDTLKARMRAAPAG